MRTLERATLVVGILLGAAPVVRGQTLTDAELDGKKFLHAKTFEGSGSGGWARDDIEIEGVFGVGGLDAKTLYRWLRAAPETREPLRGSLFTDANNFRELRRSPLCEGFSTGFPLDEIPWDADRHKVREDYPLVWMTIESDRFAVDERKNKRVLSLGTDLMDDVYFDTPSFLCLDNKMSIRARKRWDSPTEARRILIGLKRDGDVDGSGLKAVSKTDIRNDGASPAEIAQLDEAVRTGFTQWGSKEPAVPVRELYERLQVRGILPSSPTWKDVLLLEPKLFVRSLRSRYHLNETSLSSVQAVHKLGLERMNALAALSKDTRASAGFPADKLPMLQAFEAKVAGIVDRTLVSERAKAKLAELGLAATPASIAPYMPDAASLARPASVADLVAREGELKRRRAVADAVSALYHELAVEIEGGSVGIVGAISNPESLRRIVTRSTDRALEDYSELFCEWARVKDKKLGPKTTYDPFVALHTSIAANDAERQAFNTHGEAQKAANERKWRRFKSLDAKQWKDLGAQLTNEQVRIWSRQIEAAGTAAVGLWFDQARQFYVPDSSRQTSNFIIDTMDFTSMYTADAATTKDANGVEKLVDASMEIDESKLIHAVLVNEGQIELTAVGDYTRRLSDMGNGHERARIFMKWAEANALGSDEAAWKALWKSLADKGDDDLKVELAKLNTYARANGAKALELGDLRGIPDVLFTKAVRDGARNKDVDVAFAGAKFVLDQYREFLKYVANLKQAKVFDVIKAARDPGTPEPNLSWTATTGGKGEIGLALLKKAVAPGPAPLVTSDALATANNHTRATSSAVARGTTYTKLKVAAGEQDWYKLELPAGRPATFTIRFAHAGGAGDLNLALYRVRGGRSVRLASSTGTGDTESVTYRPVGSTTETLFLRVNGASTTAAADYTLEVR